MKFTKRESHQDQRTADHQEREDQQIVKQLITKVLAKRVECD
jgi:hypothetical protein